MGGDDEQHPGGSEGIGTQRPDIRLKPLPTIAEQLSLVGEAEEPAIAGKPSAFSISQQIIDEVLTSGGNEQDSTFRIAAYFKKDHTTAENADFLQKEYRRFGNSGKGFIFGGDHVSVWFSERGISIASGDTALNAEQPTLVTWEQAARRTRELLDIGRFIPRCGMSRGYPHQRRRSGAGGQRDAAPNARFAGTEGTAQSFNLLIDIQAKIREGKGVGYEQWARIFNIKHAAKTLLFLKENGIDSYEDLKKKASSASGDFSALSEKIKAADKRMAEISELQKEIVTYGKTREIYAQYKASGWDKDFYEQFRADITLHRTAKKYFDGLGLKKLPTIAALKQEYVALSAEKKSSTPAITPQGIICGNF